MILRLSDLSTLGRSIVCIGVALTVAAALLLLNKAAGIVPDGFLVPPGPSGLRPIGSLAVGGCLCIAIGFWGK
jgi:hypothetical protein